MKIREDILEADYLYHIFNRGVNSNLVFITNENMSFFLRKVEKYLLPLFEVYSYCLMPNHFHFILKPKEYITNCSTMESLSKGLHSEECVYSKALAKLISSYTQAYNKVNQRTGALFESPFKRIRIDSEKYLRNLIIYIHQNPENFERYKYSSYHAIVSDLETSISRGEVISLFDDKENFMICHQKPINENQFQTYI